MNSSKIKSGILVIMTIFVVSFIFTLIDTYPWNMSSYDLGKSTGQVFRHLFQVVIMLALMVVVIRNFQIERPILLFLTIFLFSFAFTVANSYPWNFSSYELGQLTGQLFKKMITNLFTLGMIFLTIKRFRLGYQNSHV